MRVNIKHMQFQEEERRQPHKFQWASPEMEGSAKQVRLAESTEQETLTKQKRINIFGQDWSNMAEAHQNTDTKSESHGYIFSYSPLFCIFHVKVIQCESWQT